MGLISTQALFASQGPLFTGLTAPAANRALVQRGGLAHDGEKVEPVNRVARQRDPDTVSFSAQAKEAAESETGQQQAAEDAENNPVEAGAATGSDGEPLSEQEQEQTDELKARDAEVRAHEIAHKAAAGAYARGGPTYSYQTGPDGRRYAVGGSVQIDTSPVKGDPQATIQKMAVVKRAALAPKEPSDQDRRVAAEADQKAAQARSEQTKADQEAQGSDDANALEAASNKPEASQVDQASNATDSPSTDSSAGNSGAAQSRLGEVTAQPVFEVYA